MWKRFAIAAIACIIITTRSLAQIIQPLSIGDAVSSEKFFSLLNDKDSLFNLSQSKDELLLLDFWATWCTSCIAKFPKLDSLQREFTGKLKILLVNWDEDRDKIISFLNKYTARKGSQLGLAVVAGDTVLRSFFPHYSIPHYGRSNYMDCVCKICRSVMIGCSIIIRIYYCVYPGNTSLLI